MDAEGKTLARTRVEHSESGFANLGLTLRAHAQDPHEVAAAIELNEGLLLDWLLRQGYQVLGIGRA